MVLCQRCVKYKDINKKMNGEKIIKRKKSQKVVERNIRLNSVNIESFKFKSLSYKNQIIVMKFGYLGLKLSNPERKFVSQTWMNMSVKVNQWKRWKMYAISNCNKRSSEFYYRFTADTIIGCKNNYKRKGYSKWSLVQCEEVERRKKNYGSKCSWGYLARLLSWTNGIEVSKYFKCKKKFGRDAFLQGNRPKNRIPILKNVIKNPFNLNDNTIKLSQKIGKKRKRKEVEEQRIKKKIKIGSGVVIIDSVYQRYTNIPMKLRGKMKNYFVSNS